MTKDGRKKKTQDLFFIERLYDKPENVLKTIKDWGVRVEFVATKDSPIIPVALELPFMVGTLGLIVGEKQAQPSSHRTWCYPPCPNCRHRLVHEEERCDLGVDLVEGARQI